MTTFLFVACIAAGIIIAVRLYVSLKKLRDRPRYDMDAAIIQKLRAKGADPFRAYQVDFFFALPDDESVRIVNARLEQQGFAVNVKAVPENGDLPFSVYASKSLRLSVPDMRAQSAFFLELARTNRGRYDGWAVAE